ncbi:MAG: MmcQ/YjbR family DNA-binding protein [Bacteroidota bacterium]
MDIETLREYCLSKKAASEDFPFDEVTLTFKVLGKIFAITGLDAEVPAVNLKCEPERAIELREEYEEIQPGYHMNKKHWNTVLLEGDLDDQFLKELIDHSYDMVVSKMTKKDKMMLEQLP